ncbi:MAG: hypothetical protein NZ561_09620 [Phycisphaerae bacterium]|nr:hypothetical protein [Phycisphaerae bacterium]MDW8261384.1 hypothetical protein [Phycisphaerales bacterium]
MKTFSRIRNLMLCTAAAAVLCPTAAFAGGRWDSDRHRQRELDLRVEVDFGRDRFPRCEEREERVWVEPVYRTVRDRVWVEPVYREVCDRVWHEPIYETRLERVWVEPVYEWRDVIRIDFCGNRFRARERVCVEPGRWEYREVRVCVREGYWEDVRRRELVSPGYWKTIERRECISEGYWTTRPVRSRGQLVAWYDRGERYRD